MAIKFRRPKSIAAILAFKLVSFAIAFQIIAALLHRIEFINGKTFFAISGVGFLLAVLAILCSVIAYVSLWRVAAKGGVKATFSMILALLMFAPMGFTYWQNSPVPKINDVTTDLANRPEYQEILKLRTASGFETKTWGKAQIEEHQKAYPNLKPRYYSIAIEETAKAVLDVAKQRRWKIISAPDLESNDEKIALLDNEQTAVAAAATAAAGDENEDEDDSAADAPQDETSQIIIEAIWKSLAIGFKNDVVIRLIDEDERTRVDIRASARLGKLDFRANAKEIEKFFIALDKQVLSFAKITPVE